MNPPFAPPRRDFIGKPAPPGYVAGIGRGASGFTTRSDIGPAREMAAAAALAANSAASTSGTVATTDGPARKMMKRTNDDDEEEEYLNESNYDEFAGYGGSLFSKDPYDQDDEEADRIYEQIDKHVDERGKALRETKTRQELERYRQERPKIQQQFSDLKASLRQVSELEWMNIPEVGDARNRKQRVARQDKFTPVPDSLLAHQAKLASGGEKLVYIDPKTLDPDQMEDEDDDNGVGGDSDAISKDLSTALNAAGESRGLNIGEMSELRSSYMSMKLSRISNPVDGEKVADPQDYLTNLQSMVPSQITDAATLKEYRKQFASLRASNPTFSNAWIASVRLEEAAGKLSEARRLILVGCDRCPKSADLWCEAVRLHPPDMTGKIMAKALGNIPRSVQLWIKAADMEQDEDLKRTVYRKAREMVPKSVLLWKKSVELEQPAEARAILREAVECCPESVELWLALAQLETYERARQVLIKASEKHPAERSIRIMEAKLEEAACNKTRVESIIKCLIEQISKLGIDIKRDDLLKEAEDAEKKFPATCSEIIKQSIGWKVNESDRLDAWLGDAQRFIKNGSFICARAVYQSIVREESYCKMESVWLAFANFERQHGTPDLFETVLKESIRSGNCQSSETLWLMFADQKRKNLDETRQILSNGLDANPDSEKIIIAAVELECENANHKEARRILTDACMSAKTPQLVMRAAKLEWTLGNLDEATRILCKGVEEYKSVPEFHLSLGQIEEQRGNHEKAKAYYAIGLKFNPTSVSLWISMANIEEKTGNVPKARSRLENARKRNPKVPLLWLEAARLELRAQQSKKAGNVRLESVLSILAIGIRECKDSPDVNLLIAEKDALNKPKFN